MSMRMRTSNINNKDNKRKQKQKTRKKNRKNTSSPRTTETSFGLDLRPTEVK